MSKKVGNLVRGKIYKYRKSGKIIAVLSDKKDIGIRLNSDLTQITNVESRRYFKENSVYWTGYYLEIEEFESQDKLSYGKHRILTEEDLDENLWKETDDLSKLPVTSHPTFTKEERIWAGERKGNTGVVVFIAIVVLCLNYFSFIEITSSEFKGRMTADIITAVVVNIVTLFLYFKIGWRRYQKPFAEKLAKLTEYKNNLKLNESLKKKELVTKFDKSLEEYSNWKNLTPKQFEIALSRYLKSAKYQLNLKVTQYSGDGGIDLEGTDNEGNKVIVQAKKYSKNVGVAVVREMIGVRESINPRPITYIVSLVGFTKGAIDLAKESDVRLITIRQEIIPI